jgi:hypothetical protein
LAEEVEKFYREAVADAAKTGKEIPNRSNVYEELIRVGLETKRGEGEERI